MPHAPIRLVSQQYDLDIFNGSFEEDKEQHGLSDLQKMVLSNNSVSGNASDKKQHFASLLDVIFKSEDKVVTAALKIVAKEEDKLYRVPSEISDNDLLGLKTLGLVQGQGRLVKITQSGKNLLRDKWLKSENQIRAQRSKNKFDIYQDPMYRHRKASENYIDINAKKAAASVSEDERIAIAEKLLADAKQNYNAQFAQETHSYLRYLTGLDADCPDIDIATRTLVANRFASTVQKVQRNG